MSQDYIGNCLVGNFRPVSKVDLNNGHIEKINNSLVFINGAEYIPLEPVDDVAENILREFKPGTKDNCPSIYHCEPSGDFIVVRFYAYHDTQYLDVNTQKLVIHMTRVDESKICREGGFGNGVEVEKQSEIVGKLSELFIRNHSIFVQKDDSGFTMHGHGCWAKLREDRPGIYTMIKFVVTPNSKQVYHNLYQIYGKIEFMLCNDALAEKGNTSATITPVETNEIFHAWEEYMNFKQKEYEYSISKYVLHYNSLKIDGDSLELTIDTNVDLYTVRDIEFELISMVKLSLSGEDDLSNKIKNYKILHPHDIWFIGKPINDRFKANILRFELPYKGIPDEFKDSDGIIYVSDFSLKNEHRRRMEVISTLDSKVNQTGNMIMRLSNADVVDDQHKFLLEPVTSKVKKAMFGTTDIAIKENYREAMDIALNTPDIALIQGPPGTGKTTLIKGIVERLTSNDKKCKILVSSEQHEAMYNVVNKLSEDQVLPPFITSHRRYSDQADEDKFLTRIEEYQNKCKNVCDDLLRITSSNDNFSENLASIISIINEIKESGYSLVSIMENIDRLDELLIKIGCSEAKDAVISLKLIIDKTGRNNSEEPLHIILTSVINGQRTSKTAFLDDGISQLKQLDTVLKTLGYKDRLLDKELYERLISDIEPEEEDMLQFESYVDGLKEDFVFKSNILENPQSIEDLVREIHVLVQKHTQNRKRDMHSIIESFSYKIYDISSISDVIKRYTPVIGSTCAQAKKSMEFSELKNNSYDYVIVDEAARANPLEIMIPMLMGTRVLLVGDHKQLPHYIETNILKKFEVENEKYEEFDKTLLTKSLFQIIFENLSKAYDENRLKCKRTATIEEQHRMHPEICNFISSEFYDKKLISSPSTEAHLNSYGLFNGKNAVCIDIPIMLGHETHFDQSFCRDVEVDYCLDLLKEIINKDLEQKPSIGIISFYKGQVKRINQRLNDEIPSDTLDKYVSCNTVDSYQGKEFDIVILSGVRSNALNSIGFLNETSSRVNVALSRARNLLIFVGDCTTLKANPHLYNYFVYTKENGYYESKE